MMIYLLGLGSSTHPLRPETWLAWKRTTFEYHGLRYIGSFAPLFVHRFSQAWFDFRHKRDKYADYFQNSTIATEVHRRFCIGWAGCFQNYSDDLWEHHGVGLRPGLCDLGRSAGRGPIDGDRGSGSLWRLLPFLPNDCMRIVLKNIKKSVIPRPGAATASWMAFNPLKKWYDNDMVGIDVEHHRISTAEKCAHRLCLEDLHEEPRSATRNDQRRFQSYEPGAPAADGSPVLQKMGPPGEAARYILQWNSLLLTLKHWPGHATIQPGH